MAANAFEDGALATVPTTSSRRATAMPSRLKFFYGPMDCGKSTLALQFNHNHARQGRTGLVLTRYDRSGGPVVTTRVGLRHDAIEVTDELDLRQLVHQRWAGGQDVDYLIVDEAGFLNPEHVDQLAELVDDNHVDVYCFGLLTDFRGELLPGAKRLVELADELAAIQVEVLCWCGQEGRFNARVIGGRMVHDGATVVVADTDAIEGHTPPHVRYQVLCRTHYRHSDLGRPPLPGQLTFDEADGRIVT